MATIRGGQIKDEVVIKPLNDGTKSYQEYQNHGLVSADVVKNTSGVVYSFTCYNSGNTSCFLQIHNRVTAPVTGNVALRNFWVPKKSQILIDSDMFGPNGLFCSNGIAIGWSTTYRTFNAATANNQDTEISWG